MIKENTYTVAKIANLKELLNLSTEMFCDQDAFLVKDSGGSYRGITYTQFKHDIDSLGTSLIDIGLKDKNIAVIGENSYQWCVSYMSVVCGTGIVVPLDKELPIEEIENLLKRSNSAAIFFSKKHKSQIEKISRNIDSVKYFICMDHETEENNFISFNKLIARGTKLLSKQDRRFLDAKIDSESMSILLFTSGTTDLAKGVMLSQKNICSDILSTCSAVYIGSNDRYLSMLPLHHTFECTCGFLLMVYRGVTISFSEGHKHIAKNMQETKPTILITVPLILEKMHKRIFAAAAKEGMEKKLRLTMKLSDYIYQFLGINLKKKLFKKIHDNVGGQIRLIITGAAGIDPQVASDFRSMGLKVLQGYGLTECSPVVSINRENNFIDSSIGLALPNITVKIDSPDENDIGEIIVQGDNVMLGYFENESATSSVIRDGWLYTGDLAKISKNGHIFFVGRKKNVLVTKNGKNIFPEEVELYLNKSPFIVESVIFGKEPENSDELLIEAHIVPDLDKIKTFLNKDTVSKEDIDNIISQEIKTINKELPFYKKVKKFHIREDEFEKTTTKKIKRNKIDQ
jgi:long-chain acyl-CoA synthetase